MKRLLIVAALAASACAGPAQERVGSSNPAFDVELLFETDGCRVYRFSDEGRRIYFTTCVGSTSWNQSNGKTTRPVEVPTR